MKVLYIIPILAICACTQSAKEVEKIESADALITSMHKMYEGSWYPTLTFVQHSITHRQGGVTDTAIWLEALHMPGKLRVDIEPRSDGNGFLYNADTLYNIRGGEVASKSYRVHPLLTLGFDAYFDAPAVTMAKLESLGFDFSQFREASWQGRPAYVVGAAEGDTTSAQFWIDAEHLYFVRSIQPAGPNGQVSQEIQFNKYEPLGDAWIAPEVLFFANGVMTFEEQYSEIEINMTLPDALFSATEWSTVAFWR